ncbi:hypothetical protein Daus18300_000878 [Diaporthe australafricana]|uniref:Uncharacterized protein n=1 Tax=Diaporthe australafricana TaxID=127596 RepID=A0ABR3Y1M1_9PEZI
MPPPCLLPRKGSGKATPGRRVGLPFDHTARASNAPSTTPVSLGDIHRKRSSDEEVGDIANKRRRLSPSVPSSSSMVSDRTDRNGQQIAVIDLTDDTPQASSSGLERSNQSTASLALGSSPSSKARGFPRYSRPLSASTPSHGAKQKSEVIDLTLDDDSDDVDNSTLPPTPRLKETALSEGIEDVIDLTVEDPVAPDVPVASAYQRPEPVLQHGPGQTSSVNDDHSASTKRPGYGDPRASQHGLRSALPLESSQGQSPWSAKPAQKKSATGVDQAQVSSPMSQTMNTSQSQPKLELALDTRSAIRPSQEDGAVAHSSIALLLETLEHLKVSQAGQSLRQAPSAQMPSFPHFQSNTNVDIDSQGSLHSMRATRHTKAAGSAANRLPILGTAGDSHRTQAWLGAATANSDSVSPNGSSKSFFSELKNRSGSRPSSALDIPQPRTATPQLANGLPSVGHMRQVEIDQLRRGSVVVPRVQVQDRDNGPHKIDEKPKNEETERAGDGRLDVSGSISQFEAAEPDAGPGESGGLSRAGLFKMQHMLLRRSRGDVIARNTPLSGVDPNQGRDSDVEISAQDQGRSGGGRRMEGIERDGKGSTVSDSGPLRASKLREPSGLMIQGQAQKQNELIADGLAEGSEKRDESNSSSFSPETNAQGNGRPQSLQQLRRKLQKIVTLKVPPRELQRISERPVQRPDLPMGECFLMRCPMEVQEIIYKHLLVADGPIQVINGWSKLHQRQRSYLHPAILLTCKTFSKNALAVLYGQNVFQYILRETAPFAAGFREGEQSIHIAKYTPCFRKLELKIERSRTDFAYCNALARAIDVLNTHGARLNQLVLDISPSVEGNTLSTVGYFYRQGDVMEALKALRTRFIEVRVLTPKTRSAAPASFRYIIDRGFTVDDSSELPWAQPVKLPLENLSAMISLACENPSKAVARGWFKKFEPTSRRGIERFRPKKKDQDDNQGSQGNNDNQGSNGNNDDQSGEGDNDDQSSDGDEDDQSSNDDDELSIDDGDDSGDFKG